MIFYELDQVAQAKRYFSKYLRYSDIDWTNLDQIVDAYRQRIQDWYLDPARELAKIWDFAFSVMALNCLLIDTLSQFVAGIDSSNSNQFKEFISKRLPSTYSSELKTPIQHDDGSRTKPRTLRNVADVLYHGFRCGILHQAHIPPYCGVALGVAVCEFSEQIRYKASGVYCTSVVVDPLALREALDEAFEVYLRELKDRDLKNNPLRENFKRKFSNSFGIDINHST